MKKILISVYGSLRKGMHNHNLLLNAKYLGEFLTEPEFSLYSLGSFPGLKLNGSTSVLMEVYEVTEHEAHSVDMLEGYYEKARPTFYDKISIQTPYGTASTYIYVNNISESSLVESGDWKEFKEKITSYRSISNN